MKDPIGSLECHGGGTCEAVNQLLKQLKPTVELSCYQRLHSFEGT